MLLDMAKIFIETQNMFLKNSIDIHVKVILRKTNFIAVTPSYHFIESLEP